MSDWIALAPAILAATGILWLPGLLIAAALGLRGFLLCAVAPALSVAVLASSAVVAPLLGLAWTAQVWTATTLMVAFFSGAIWWLAGRPKPALKSRRQHAAVIVAVGAGSVALSGLVLQMRRMMKAISDPAWVSQTFDANYHLNAVLLMQETRNASSLHMTLATPERESNFYPAAWHNSVLAIMDVTGIGVAEATNVLGVVVASLVWPLGVLAFMRILVGPRPVPLAFAVLIATALPQFPNLMLEFGVLYPNLLGYALLPSALAMVLHLLKGGRQSLTAAAGLGLVAVGLVLAHPNSAFALVFLSLPILVDALLRWSSPRCSRSAGQVLAIWAAGLLVLIGGWLLLGTVPAIASLREMEHWQARSSLRQAIWQILGLSTGQLRGEPQLLLALAVAFGAIVALRSRSWRWMPFSYAIAGTLCVLAVAGTEPYRSYWTGFWYTDPHRLAALLPVLGVPLAALGTWRVFQLLDRGLRRWIAGRPRLGIDIDARGRVAGALVLGFGGVVLLGYQTPLKGSFQGLADAHSPEQTAAGSAELVSVEEYELMEMLPEIVPAGVRVAGNPWDGSAMSWAIGDREPVYPHPGMTKDEDRAIVADRLNQAHTDPRVCEAVDALDLGYVLRLGPPLWGFPADRRVYEYQGLTALVAHDVAEEVASIGNARLLRLTACGPAAE